MSWRSHLREDCETLNARLRQRKIPRGKRAVARRLLSRIFSIESNAEAAESSSELRRLAREVEKMVHPLDSEWSPRTLVRLETFSPIRLRFAVSHTRIRDLCCRYFEKADRLDRIVEWFWARCAPEDTVARERTIQEKALDEFTGEDMEYVWGRRRYRGP
ncbi:MAG: hypothetical protein VX223_18810 [Myxococcota bacterium]|nr:hypothetical protein [Myxococcota bacterium]